MSCTQSLAGMPVFKADGARASATAHAASSLPGAQPPCPVPAIRLAAPARGAVERLVEAIDHQPEAGRWPWPVEQAEDPRHLDALIVAVVLARPEGRCPAMRVQVHRDRLVVGHGGTPIADMDRRGLLGLAHRQPKMPGAARIDQHPGGFIGQAVPARRHERFDQTDGQHAKAEAQVLRDLAIGQAHGRRAVAQVHDAVEPIEPGLHEPPVARHDDALAVVHVRQRAEARRGDHRAGGEQGLVSRVHRAHHVASGSPSSWPSVVLASTSTRSGKRVKRPSSMSRQKA